MRALVRYIIWFVSDAIGMGARVRGPGFGSDVHLVPTSRAKPQDFEFTDEELTGSRYRWTRADAGVSHIPLKERSFAMYEEANASGAGTAVPNVIPFPISHRKAEVDDVKDRHQKHGGTAKIQVLFYWSLVGWLLFNL
jgi:hypothetical protein